MGRVKIKYYHVVKGSGYWNLPRKTAEQYGLPTNVRCGHDGPDAWKIAETWNKRLFDARRGLRYVPESAKSAKVYPPGSLGEAFQRYRHTDQWKTGKKPRTREDWDRVWARIEPIFGDLPPAVVMLEHIDAWRAKIRDDVSISEAHRAIKIWRALWKVAAAMGYCSRTADPSMGLTNIAPRGRKETWTEGEAVRLVKRAWRMGYHGLACCIAVAWDTHLSPVDARSLEANQIVEDKDGTFVTTSRTKTGKEVTPRMSLRTAKLIAAYRKKLGAETIGAAFRTPRGVAYTKNSLAEHFREVRQVEFPGDQRKLLDMRRSGAQEAIIGGATAEMLSLNIGNTLSTSNKLFDTYVPGTKAASTIVAERRLVGRREMRKK